MSATAPQKRPQMPSQQPLPSHSTVITHTGYDAHSQTFALVISGNPDYVYLYQNVTAAMASGFERAKSKGMWFDQELRPYLNLHPFMKVAVVGETV